MDRDDFDLLLKADICKMFNVDERTVERMVSERLMPRPTKYGKQVRWRWGIIRKWMEATETLQGMGVILPDDEVCQSPSNTVDSPTIGDSDQNGSSNRPTRR